MCDRLNFYKFNFCSLFISRYYKGTYIYVQAGNIYVQKGIYIHVLIYIYRHFLDTMSRSEINRRLHQTTNSVILVKMNIAVNECKLQKLTKINGFSAFVTLPHDDGYTIRSGE